MQISFLVVARRRRRRCRRRRCSKRRGSLQQFGFVVDVLPRRSIAVAVVQRSHFRALVTTFQSQHVVPLGRAGGNPQRFQREKRHAQNGHEQDVHRSDGEARQVVQRPRTVTDATGNALQLRHVRREVLADPEDQRDRLLQRPYRPARDTLYVYLGHNARGDGRVCVQQPDGQIVRPAVTDVQQVAAGHGDVATAVYGQFRDGRVRVQAILVPARRRREREIVAELERQRFSQAVHVVRGRRPA